MYHQARLRLKSMKNLVQYAISNFTVLLVLIQSLQSYIYKATLFSTPPNRNFIIVRLYIITHFGRLLQYNFQFPFFL